MSPARLISILRLRLRSVLLRKQVERELAEELELHLEHRAAYEIAEGRSPDEARRIARHAMQGVEQQKELCRDARGLAWVENLVRDLRLGLRALRNSPGFTVVAVLTLTLGIGANTAIYSVVHAVLLRPLPFAEPDSLVRIYETNTGIDGFHFNLSSPNLLYLRGQARSFESIAALGFSKTFTLAGDAGAQQVSALLVTADFLAAVDASPALGRPFEAADVVEDRQVVLLSHELWTGPFHADPGVIGREIRLDAEPHTVIGVLPQGFRSPWEYGTTTTTDLLIPYGLANADSPRYNYVVARLAPGVTLEQAQAEADTLSPGLERAEAINRDRDPRLHVVSLHEDKVGNYRNSLLVLLASAGVVLLISCANLANALLARGAVQAREYAVRLALGASRGALIRQILAQNLLLAALGCASGLFAAYASVETLVVLAPSRIPRLDEVAIDAPTLAFAVAVSLFTVVAFGLLPALRFSSCRPNEAMQGRGTAGGLGDTRWRGALIAAQAGLSIVLLVGAGLLLRSFAHLRGVDLGFETSRTVAFNVRLPDYRYRTDGSRVRFYDALAERVESLPGVESVGYASMLPLRLLAWGPCNIDSPPAPQSPGDPLCFFQTVSPDYFRTLGIPLLEGRFFTSGDTGWARVVLVNRAFAQRYWPNGSPLGYTLRYGRKQHQATIVGVVGDVRVEGPASAAPLELYFSSTDVEGLPMRPSDFAFKASGDPMALIPAIRAEVQALDSELAVSSVQTMDEVVSKATSEQRFHALLLGLFAALALVLAAVGVYGVAAYAAAQRRREIGVRVAVGARPPDIVALILGRIGRPVAAGVAVGLAAAFALTRVAEAMLFGVGPRDPATFLAATAALLAAGLIAALAPALRAARVDPVQALRID
jgi:putative ABC transport system permease protein